MNSTMQNPTAAAHASSNGGALPNDATVIELLRKEIEARRRVIAELRAELAVVAPELRRYEKVLAMLTGEAPERKSGPKPKADRKRSTPSKIGEERLAAIREAIFTYAKDHDEFSQVDIRATSGIDKSSVMAMAFEQLRQEGMIRFARRDGMRKLFRLTNAALRDRQ